MSGMGVQMSVSIRALLAGVGLLGVIGASPAAVAQQGAAASEDEIVVTGTRAQNRSALSTAAPVDVVSAADLAEVGVQEVNQALSVELPSFTFPRPGLADGTDTVRPASLRGLAPDQTLVLVNSKRRHTAALVNLNATVGRGSAAVDLNAIPVAAIGSIEVLRDGASAQYGSDAIAGVINVRLREARSGGNVTASYGERRTTVETLVGAPPAGATWSVSNLATRDVTDGETVRLSGWTGLGVGENGFITVSAEYLDQAKTVRAAPDWRQQYALVNGAFDPRERTINRINAWYGEPEVEQYTLLTNAGYDFESGSEIYGWLGYQSREALSAGFFRRPLQDQQINRDVFPDGFLPQINPLVKDYSGGVGYKTEIGGWDTDTSFVFGYNDMEFTIRNTVNASLPNSRQTVFYAGSVQFDQQVLNFTAVNGYDLGLASPVNVAFGVEARREAYSLEPGEPNSYIDGGRLVGPNLNQRAVAGAQVFPGFKPSYAVDTARRSVGVFLDLEANLSERLLASAAIRGESYSDFGENLTGKLALRYDFTDFFALRGSVQNGFRAPSLQQANLANTATNFINGVPFEIITLPVSRASAQALGARPLDAETSINYALGAVLRAGDFNLTIDAYRIEVEDRIVFSENLTQTAVINRLEQLGEGRLGGARFFINGVDTETEGVDIVANYTFAADRIGEFDVTVGANFNETTVTRVPVSAALTALGLPANALFGRVNVLTFEKGTPKDKYTASVDWELGRYGASVRAIRYGEVLSPGTTAANDLVLQPKTLVDLEGRVKLTDSIGFALGADNVFDEYPTQTPPALNTTSNTPFSNLSPFGRSGRFVYGRISYNW